MEKIESYKKQFTYYRQLSEKTFLQLSDEELFWRCNEDENSIVIIANHIIGNMLSRWTDFRTTDGEKEWRNRENEFADVIESKEELMDKWNGAWTVFEDALASTNDADLGETIYIRNQGHTISEAINRQLAHYAYHIGQIVFLGKLIKGQNWTSLSIPKGKSNDFNKASFAKGKRKEHFTDALITKDKN